MQSDGHDGGSRLDHRQADSRPRGPQVSVVGSGAFRKEQNGASAVESVQNGFESRPATPFAVDRNGIQFADIPTEQGNLEQGVTGEEIHRPRNGSSDEGWVRQAGVVGGQDDGANGRDTLHVFDPSMVHPTGGESGQPPSGAVGPAHLGGQDVFSGELGRVSRGGCHGGGQWFSPVAPSIHPKPARPRGGVLLDPGRGHNGGSGE